MKNILAICDREEQYLYHMVEYLERKEILPFVIHAFTDCVQLKSFLGNYEVKLLLIAENAFEEELQQFSVGEILILNESGNEAGNGIQNINKYQSSENIFHAIMDCCMENLKEIPQRIAVSGKMKIVGLYTPVGRCLQTTFGLCMGQLLAKKQRVLYLNFEAFSGLAYLLNKSYTSDITDVLYFLSCDKEKLVYRLGDMVQSLNGLDYIPPALSGRDLQGIDAEQWIQLLLELQKITDYEYLILDLTDQVRGLFEVLKECHCIFTITRQEEYAKAKLRQYEAAVQSMNCEEIIIKTRKQNLPLFSRVPEDLGQLTHGEIAAYAKKVIEEELGI